MLTLEWPITSVVKQTTLSSQPGKSERNRYLLFRQRQLEATSTEQNIHFDEIQNKLITTTSELERMYYSSIKNYI